MMDPSLPAYGYALGAVHNFLVLSTPDLPPDAWWIPALILFILGAGAAIDSFKAIVPDPLMFFGVVGIVGLEGMYVSWPYSAHQLTWGLVTMAIIWAVNEVWYRCFKQDALGLGDAKWSMLAVTCFGGIPVLVAWGIGAVLGCIWISGCYLIRRPARQVHFAPFLFIGLIGGIWVVRMNGMEQLLVALHAP